MDVALGLLEFYRLTFFYFVLILVVMDVALGHTKVFKVTKKKGAS